MNEKTILVWFRNDLRIHDNEILTEAVRKADKVLPVYCFDPFYFKKNSSGNTKTGEFRARFLLESVADLRKNLRHIGGELIIRVGNPAEVLLLLAEQYDISEVYHHREVAFEETDISAQVEAALWKIKLNLKHFIGHTLYHKEDLPFPIKDIPDSFAIFKKKIERDSSVRQCIATPEKISTPAIVDAGELPSLKGLGLKEPLDDPRSAMQFTGGETAAIKQLDSYFINDNPTAKLKNVPPSLLSPWLALGCLSLRQVYWEVIRHQEARHPVYTHLLLDLLWRDYFRFMFKKHGQKFIDAKDTSIQPENAINQEELFEAWKNGETGAPLIDAIMHELNATGYINNHKRQVTAAFLINNLKVDWTKGAAYFEERLIDYSPASNWGNWAFIAGINDARESRYQIAAKAALEMDVKNDYIDTWSPALLA
jgi:deoxyribodipyrimidine photo-lyase